MVKTAKYEPFGDELSAEVAYIQAATVLDIVVKKALEQNDLDTLTDAVALWLSLGEKLLNPPAGIGEEEEDTVPLPSKGPLGFTCMEEENDRAEEA